MSNETAKYHKRIICIVPHSNAELIARVHANKEKRPIVKIARLFLMIDFFRSFPLERTSLFVEKFNRHLQIFL